MADEVQAQLRDQQYKTADNLNARIALHARFSTNPYGWFRWVFDHLPLAERSRILELGCGPAKLWSANRQRIPAGWSIYLSDFSPGMLTEAREAMASMRAAFTFQLIDAAHIPSTAGLFNGVLANHMLYHVPDRKQALNEIARVLSADGCLVATTVGTRHLQELEARLLECGADPSQLGGPATAAFTLENGAPQLERVFRRVELYRYTDSLRVTEVEPLIAFVQSMIRATQLPAGALARLRAACAETIATHGVLHITKDSGLFIARGPRG
jgi:ubiquinone/menaquinone biosynthesis C-methylase UbiE